MLDMPVFVEKEDMDELTRHLKQYAREIGADLVGVADLKLLEGIETEPKDLLAGYRYGISLAVKLPNAVFDQLEDRPTPLYAQVYATANALLDQISLKLSRWIEMRLGRALPIPASLPLDPVRLTAHLSAKAVANAAGLGWQGKSLLIITPQFGPLVRLVTVLTDLPLTADHPVKNRCGHCTRCTEACVAGAIKNVATDFHYASRDEALDFDRCAEKLVGEFKKLPNVAKPICGICIKVCPWGKS